MMSILFLPINRSQGNEGGVGFVDRSLKHPDEVYSNEKFDVTVTVYNNLNEAKELAIFVSYSTRGPYDLISDVVQIGKYGLFTLESGEEKTITIECRIRNKDDSGMLEVHLMDSEHVGHYHNSEEIFRDASKGLALDSQRSRIERGYWTTATKICFSIIPLLIIGFVIFLKYVGAFENNDVSGR